jgi:uncharacterized protein
MASPAHPVGPDRPGSHGEHLLQRLLGTDDRAAGFYAKQVLDHLNPRMREFIDRQEMAFVATADIRGECDCTFRAGPPGFIRVINDRTLAYPEYRGNGVMASLGNIVENGHIGILMVDFFDDLVGLHVNGRAELLTGIEAAAYGLTGERAESGRRVERWVAVNVEEAYIHCSKNIPLLKKEDRRARIADRSVHPAGSGYFSGTERRDGEETLPEQASRNAPVPSPPVQDMPVQDMPVQDTPVWRRVLPR